MYSQKLRAFGVFDLPASLWFRFMQNTIVAADSSTETFSILPGTESLAANKKAALH
jgi:hypothetical protein